MSRGLRITALLLGAVALLAGMAVLALAVFFFVLSCLLLGYF